MDKRWMLLGLALLGGCWDASAVPVRHRQDEVTHLAETHDADATGVIAGRVVWDGDVPEAVETVVHENAYNPFMYQKPAKFRTPHVPQVHSGTGGVANAVVYLKDVEACRSKPWSHPKARVVFHERDLRVVQGDHTSQVGFVQRGSSIEVVNQDDEYHLLRGRGAAFFAIPLKEKNHRHDRALTESGVVELTCSAGWYWYHAHLFVSEHPYYVCTDSEGRFRLDGVPEGTYDVVCWLPNWRIARRELDPETANVARLAWHTPREQTQKVRVQRGGAVDVPYRWTKALFE